MIPNRTLLRSDPVTFMLLYVYIKHQQGLMRKLLGLSSYESSMTPISLDIEMRQWKDMSKITI